MGNIKKTYSQDFKYEVVKMYLEEGRTSYELSKSMGLDAKMIRRWVHAYREHGIAVLAKQRGGAKRSSARCYLMKKRIQTMSEEFIVFGSKWGT